jgi:hypothetical protein
MGGANPEGVSTQRFLSANCFGDYLTRDGIGIPVRELITFAMLAALNALAAINEVAPASGRETTLQAGAHGDLAELGQLARGQGGGGPHPEPNSTGSAIAAESWMVRLPRTITGMAATATHARVPKMVPAACAPYP